VTRLTRRYVVQGRVQGVGFRYFVLRRARDLGLCGSVRNLRDGAVEVVARGDPASLSRLEGELRSGPALAHVTNVEIHEISDDIDIASDFRVMG
jgi:acylphosphatase